MTSLREKYPLEKRKILKKTISRMSSFFLLLFFLILPLTIIMWNEDLNFRIINYLALILLTFLIISVTTYIYETFYLKYYFYTIIGDTLIIRKGVFSRNEISLPFNRLQDVYVNQDILDRIFSLYDLHVSSATYISGSLSHIDGLNKDNVEIIKELLLKGIGKHE